MQNYKVIIYTKMMSRDIRIMSENCKVRFVFVKSSHSKARSIIKVRLRSAPSSACSFTAPRALRSQSAAQRRQPISVISSRLSTLDPRILNQKSGAVVIN